MGLHRIPQLIITLRIILGMSIMILFFVAPFWLPLCLVLIGLFFIPYYWESVALLFCAELLYHHPFLSLSASLVSPSIMMLVLFFAVQHFRKIAQEQLFHF